MARPVDYPITQTFGAFPTRDVRPGNPDYWIIELFGDYQPDGHAGFDCACPVGTPVRAVADGKVLHVGWMSGTYADNPWWIAPNFAGYCAVIDHGTFIGIYGHCRDGSAKVAKGARVREGQVFIESGNTGGSTGAHLHFEVLPDGYVLNSRFYGRVNPMPYVGSASIGPAGETTTPQEDELSAAEVKEIKDHINAVCIGGYEWGDEKRPGIWAVAAETQRRVDFTNEIIMPGERGKRSAGPLFATLAAIQGENAGLLAALKATGSGQPVDLEVVKAAAKAGSQEALAELQAVATTTVTLEQGDAK